MSIKIIICLTLIILSVSADQLKFVIELYRHGARYAVSKFWDGPQQEQNEGELTATGMRQQYVLGKTLRKEYIEEKKFLSPVYNHSEIYIRSTDVNRTLMSAISQLYGLYPPGTGPTLPPGLNPELTLPPYEGVQYEDIGQEAIPLFFQSMPVHSVALNQDNLLHAFSFDACPKIYEYAAEFYAEHLLLIEKISKQFESTFDQLAQILNLPRKKVNFISVDSIFDVFVADIYNNRPLPAGLTADLFANLTFLDDVEWFMNYGTEKIKRLVNHNMFKQYLDYLDPVVQNTNQNGLKWVMLSAHDSTVAPVMAGLNFSDYQCLLEVWNTGHTNALNCEQRPFYAANIILELYELTSDQTNNNQTEPNNNDELYDIDLQQGFLGKKQKNNTENNFYVMIKYDGKYMNLCEKKDTKCNYKEFKERLTRFMYSDKEFEKKCFGGKATQYVAGIVTGNFWIYLCTFEALALVVILFAVYKRRKQPIQLNNKNIELTEIFNNDKK